MVKLLNRQETDTEIQSYLKGCMWNILHILDYHHWQSAKRTSRRKKNRNGRRTIGSKTDSFEHFKEEVQNYVDADAVSLHDERQKTKATSTDGNTRKARIKALVAKEMSARSRFMKTDPVLRLGPAKGLHQIIILQKSADTSSSELLVPSQQNPLSAKQEFFSENGYNKLTNSSSDRSLSGGSRRLQRESSYRQFVECVDVLELFRVNKKLFLEILQDPNAQAAKNFHVQLTSDPATRLKKSGSFPSAGSPQRSYLRPTTLEHKKKEIWSFPKEEKFSVENEEPKIVASTSSEDSQEESTDLKSNNSVFVPERGYPSSASCQASNKQGWHQSFMTHVKDVVKKIKHTLKESKRQNNRKSKNVNGIISQSRISAYENETPVVLNSGMVHRDGEENLSSFRERSVSNNDLSKSKLLQMRRVSSLNESMDRYSRLFEHSLSSKNKWQGYQSKSLKLSNEDTFPSTGNSFKSFTRRLSMPDLDSLYPFPSDDALHSGLPPKTVKEDAKGPEKHNFTDKEQLETLATAEKTGGGNNLAELEHEYSDDRAIDIEEIANTEEQEEQECSSWQDQETNSNKDDGVAVLETDFRQDSIVQADLPLSQGVESDSKLIYIDEPDSPIDRQDESSSCISTDSKIYEIANTTVDDIFLHPKLSEAEETDFGYVKDVLDISGLIEQGFLGTWHSLDQPLSPTLFKELESYLHHESESSAEDFVCDHQLLFDLINEVLLQMYESSLAYFPKPFSFTQSIRPVPKGMHIVEEVWKRVSWYRSSRTRTDQSLDDIVNRDLAKDDSWMKLQIDAEDIALDLEDLIFDDLINEAICSWERVNAS